LRVDVRKLDGTLLARQLHVPAADVNVWLPFSVESPTPALLVISIEDDYGRLFSVNSVGIELLPDGESRLEPEGNPAIEFSAPRDGMRIEGSRVRIYAFADSEDGRAFNIRMITRESRVVASQDVYSKDGIVQAEVQANIDQPAFVRITISRSVNGVVFDLDSVEVELIP
jgi:hypothetical protein